jgi:hypothetical protein
MSKMGELVMEAEELLYKGYTAQEVAKILNVPVYWIEPIEEDIMSLCDPRNYGPDYDEE